METKIQKTEETAEVAVHQAPQQTNILLDKAGTLKELFTNGALEGLKSMEKSPLNISVIYADFIQNEAKRFIFLGITEVPTEDGEIMPAVVLIDGNGDTFVNQGTLLVEAFRKNNVPLQTPVEVSWTGVRKTAKGNQMRTWRVNLLK